MFQVMLFTIPPAFFVIFNLLYRLYSITARHLH